MKIFISDHVWSSLTNRKMCGIEPGPNWDWMKIFLRMVFKQLFFSSLLFSSLQGNTRFIAILKKIFIGKKIILGMRVFYLTESRWPNEYDRNWWTWPKNWKLQTLTWWIWPKWYIHPVMFVVVVIFIIFLVFGLLWLCKYFVYLLLQNTP